MDDIIYTCNHINAVLFKKFSRRYHSAPTKSRGTFRCPAPDPKLAISFATQMPGGLDTVLRAHCVCIDIQASFGHSTFAIGLSNCTDDAAAAFMQTPQYKEWETRLASAGRTVEAVVVTPLVTLPNGTPFMAALKPRIRVADEARVQENETVVMWRAARRTAATGSSSWPNSAPR